MKDGRKHNGGKRKGAGRPRSKDKRKQIRISLHESAIKKLGGERTVQEMLLMYADGLTDGK